MDGIRDGNLPRDMNGELESLSNAILDYDKRKIYEEWENNLQRELDRILADHGVVLAPKGTWIDKLSPGQAGIIAPWLATAQEELKIPTKLTLDNLKALTVPVEIIPRGTTNKLHGTSHAIVERRTDTGEYVVTHLLYPGINLKDVISTHRPPDKPLLSASNNITIKGALRFESIAADPFHHDF